MTKFLHLSIKNFLSYKTLEVNLDDIVYTSVIGENGAGKSAIPQAIAWLVYGSGRFGNSADSIVNDEAKTASGSLTLSDRDGQVWRIDRSWTTGKGGGGGLELFMKDDSAEDGWTKFGDKLIDTAQKQIQSIVGLSRDAFYSLVIMDQSKYPGGTAFTATDSNKRREILTGLVPELAIWHELEVAARSEVKEATKDYESVVSKIDLNVDQISTSRERESSIALIMEDYNEQEISKEVKSIEKRIGKLHQAIGAASSGEAGAIQAKIDSATANHNLLINKLDSEADQIDRQLEDNDRLQKDFDGAVQEKAQLEHSISGFDETLEDLSHSLNEELSVVTESLETIERVEPKVRSAEALIAELSGTISDLDERIEALGASHDSGSCWVCGSELSEEKHSKILSDVVAKRDEAKDSLAETKESLLALKERLGAATDDQKNATAEVGRLKNAIETAKRKSEENLTRIESVENSMAEIAIKLMSGESVEALTNRLTELEDSIALNNKEFETVTIRVLREELKSVESSNNTDDLTAELNGLERELVEVNSKKSKLERLAASLEEAQRNTKDLNRENKSMNRDLEEKKARVDRLTKLVHATSAKGIPAILLDSILEAIEHEQNIILESLSGTNQMRVEFSQERENKGGGSKEVLDIIVHTADGNSRLYESFSFGERVRISISNLFAMIKVFNERSGGMVSTLFLDEPLGPLDKGKIPAFIDILRIAMNQGLVDSIFVITHDDRVIEAMPQQVQVSIDPTTKVSSIEVI